MGRGAQQTFGMITYMRLTRPLQPSTSLPLALLPFLHLPLSPSLPRSLVQYLRLSLSLTPPFSSSVSPFHSPFLPLSRSLALPLSLSVPLSLALPLPLSLPPLPLTLPLSHSNAHVASRSRERPFVRPGYYNLVGGIDNRSSPGKTNRVLLGRDGRQAVRPW